MFDARPLSMTRAGKIQNYLGEEPGVWTGRNGVTTLATRLVAPLRPFRDRFSVLNGVYMTPSFDGHLQNMNFLFSGSPFGGDSFIPHLNAAETGRGPGIARCGAADRSRVRQRQQPFRRRAARAQLARAARRASAGGRATSLPTTRSAGSSAAG